MDWSEQDLTDLREQARLLRLNVLKMVWEAGSGHLGGSFSMADIVTVLYSKEMRYRAEDPEWVDRDRFVLSKGHGAPALYATLAAHGYFPEHELMQLRKLGAMLQGHPHRGSTPGVEASTGSEGHGLSISLGMAIAGKLDAKDFRTYVMLGDGELDCGQVWEAAMASPHFGVHNLTAIVDRNGLQMDSRTEDVMPLEPLADKWRAFGWHVLEIDGHDVAAILTAFKDARAETKRPTVIIATTVKGKGVSFMEDQIAYHGKKPSEEGYALALTELGGEP